jgi:hypothetical protein
LESFFDTISLAHVLSLINESVDENDDSSSSFTIVFLTDGTSLSFLLSRTGELSIISCAASSISLAGTIGDVPRDCTIDVSDLTAAIVIII